MFVEIHIYDLKPGFELDLSSFTTILICYNFWHRQAVFRAIVLFSDRLADLLANVFRIVLTLGIFVFAYL